MEFAKNSILIAGSALFLYHYVKTKRELNSELKKRKSEYAKHNCVVMYASRLGLCGWPEIEFPNRLSLNLNNVDEYCKPVVHFIETAYTRLDIAVMYVNFKLIGKHVINALKRGVAVRIMTDGDPFDDKSHLKILRESGAEILFYGEDKQQSIMHYKYMIKDTQDENMKRCAICGSMNWSLSAMCNNYEDMIFFSDEVRVQFFSDNFEECWKYLQKHQDQHESLFEI